MDANTIIGLLCGSLGTIIIGKAFDFFTEKIAFERELKRQFFAKKLEAAEQATKWFVSARDNGEMLRISLKMLIEDGDVFHAFTLLKEAGEKCKFLGETSNNQLNMINLYFDLKSPAWYPAENASDINNLFSELLKKIRIANELDNEKHHDILKEEAKQIISKLIKCICLEKDISWFHAQAIRNELKRYNH